jgi:acyl-CoA reductase-like NAD-dependent aldehyde dehydrogenase
VSVNISLAEALPRGRGAFVGGEWFEEGEEFASVNPATEEPIALLAASPEDLIERAIEAARSAHEAYWAPMSPKKRKLLLESLADACEREIDKLAFLETTDNGVPYPVVRSFSAAALVANLRYFAEWIDKIAGEVVPLSTSRAFDFALLQPYGVVAVLTAYNTPLLFLGSKAGAALAAGNTVVIKPSPLASLPALRFAELASEVGFPPGVVNVVLGGASQGSFLAQHEGVDKVSFTGSRAGGKAVARAAATHLTPVALELGGKSPAILLRDADISSASSVIALGSMALSGQACVASSRVYVPRERLDEVAGAISRAVEGLKVGDPLEPGTVLGPLISEEHRERVEKVVAEAVEAGAAVALEGGRPEGLGRGYYLRPWVLVEPPPDSYVAREEVFGPVVAIWGYEDEEEVLSRANGTPYGLGAGVFGKDVGRVLDMARRLAAGNVWVNCYGTVPYSAPFGGFKESGYGREGGHWGIEEFLQVKNVYISLQ